MTKLIRKIKTYKHAFAAMFAMAVVVMGYMLTLPSPDFGKVKDGSWVKIDPQDIELQLGLVGRIESVSRQIMAAPFDGVIEEIDFTDGAVVNEGDLLITIDTHQIDILMRQALSELIRARQAMRTIQDWENGDEVVRARRSVAMAELNTQNTISKLTESRHLYERGIVARMEVDALEQQLKLQNGEVVAAQSDLRSTMARGAGEARKIAEMDLVNAQARYDDLVYQRGKRELKAAVKGIALRPPKIDGPGQTLPIQVGQKVVAGTALVEVANIAHVRALARVEESDLHVLHEGMDVRVSSDGFNGTLLQGKIISIGAQAIPSGTVDAAGSYEVLVDIFPLSLEQQKVVRLGMSARLNVVTYSAKNSIVVPASAVKVSSHGVNVVSYRPSLSEPSKDVQVTIGRSVPNGLEVLGLRPGYVMSSVGS